MQIKNKLWLRCVPFLLLLLLSSCSIFKTRTVLKTDSIFVDKTKIVTERIVDTVITIKTDTIKYSFIQPKKDTTLYLSTKNGGSVRIIYKNGIYTIASITAEKAIPIRIYEKKIEYRNVFIKQKGKSVVAKGNFNYSDFFIFLIISIIVITLVLKSKLKQYVQTKIKFW
jgi:hypothetical protein